MDPLDNKEPPSIKKVRSWLWMALIATVLIPLIHFLQFGSTPSHESELVSVSSRVDSVGRVNRDPSSFIKFFRANRWHAAYSLQAHRESFIVALPDVPQFTWQVEKNDSVTLFVSRDEWESRHSTEDITVYGIRKGNTDVVSAKDTLEYLHNTFPFHPVFIAVAGICILGLLFIRG